ncbi:unknown protein [Waddlia chondrophila 2032/99]|uniref:Uncharacterized protein n=1 Tax=Waddlia chondrophila 2032/99 TaxID=765953 RepID=F8LEA1_9BACT|nr:unknown protein [Waddlia chondrophila 2032/99]
MDNESERIKKLTKIILDPLAADHEKDDAAMDLEDYNDIEALEALIKVASDPSANDLFALPQYGETIGIYWIRNDDFKKNIFLSLKDEAQGGVLSSIMRLKPEWIERYRLM